MDAQPYPAKLPRTLLLAGFLIGAVWFVVSQRVATYGAQAIANRANAPAVELPIELSIFFVLVVSGLQFIDWLLFRSRAGASRRLFVQRTTTLQELQRGLAVGWGAALVTVLPMVAVGALHPQFTITRWSLPWLIVSVVTLGLSTLTLVVAFQGYLLRWMREAFGATMGAVFVSLLYAVLWAGRPDSSSGTATAAFLMSFVLCLAYKRTHAIWVAWGLRLGWTATFAILFGLRVSGVSAFNGFVTTEADERSWLTGGFYGPDGSFFAIVVLLVTIFVIYRTTREYAWLYTHEPIVGKAYAVVIAPPAAHVAMEQTAATALAPLVQILATTSTRPSMVAEIEDHLRADGRSTPES